MFPYLFIYLFLGAQFVFGLFTLMLEQYLLPSVPGSLILMLEQYWLLVVFGLC